MVTHMYISRIVWKELVELQFQVKPPYLSIRTPTDLFSKLKLIIAGKNFKTDEKVIAVIEQYFDWLILMIIKLMLEGNIWKI